MEGGLHVVERRVYTRRVHPILYMERVLVACRRSSSLMRMVVRRGMTNEIQRAASGVGVPEWPVDRERIGTSMRGDIHGLSSGGCPMGRWAWRGVSGAG